MNKVAGVAKTSLAFLSGLASEKIYKGLFILTVLACIVLVAAHAYAASADDLLGVWNTEDKEARVEIYKCGDKKYCGKIIWLLEPNYPEGSEEGIPGTPKLDRYNPDPELRGKPLVGLPILKDFVFDGDDTWKNGRIYNSENGKTYSGRMTLVSPDQLDVRGFIGIPLFGGTTTWRRSTGKVREDLGLRPSKAYTRQ